MFALIKDIHNIVRWIVLLVGVWAVVRAWWGLLVRKEWSKGDRRAGIIFTSALDIQLLLGVILYFISPLTQSALRDFSGALDNAETRFFAFTHIVWTLLAAVLAHLGRASTKKAPTTRTRFRRAALTFTLALVLILLGIPWLWLDVGRAWLPGFLMP